MFETSNDPASRHAYRAKLLHPDGGIETTVEIMAATLREAEEQVRGLANSYEVEIWEGGKMVKRIPFRSGRC